MARTVLGIDIGYDSLKLALLKGRQVRKTARVQMPDGLLRDGRVVSVETMGELLRDTVKKNGLSCGRGALVLSGETVFLRNVILPRMTEEQLLYNLPYEFRDYITGEARKYIFDYAMLSREDEGASEGPGETSNRSGSTEETGDVAAGTEEASDLHGVPGDPFGTGDETGAGSGTMELMAAAVQADVLDDSRAFLRRAGMKLVMAAPPICAYGNLIRSLSEAPPGKEYCILDLGSRAIRMHIFREDRHLVTRELETGLSGVEEAVAELFGVDIHLARTYLMKNHEGCQNHEVCLSAFSDIAVELLRALNFFRFSTQDNSLEDLWLGGGGANISALRHAIGETLDIRVHPVSELVPGGSGIEDCSSMVQAIGIAME